MIIKKSKKTSETTRYQLSKITRQCGILGNEAKKARQYCYSTKSYMDSSKFIKQREMHLKTLRRWCMDRISIHSLSGEHEDAQAISDEHMEMLMGANEEHTLWMRIEKTN